MGTESEFFASQAYLVVDDLVPKSIVELTEKRLLDNTAFPWYVALYKDSFSTVSRSKWGEYQHNKSFLEGPQLCHSVVSRGEILNYGEVRMIEPLIQAASAQLGGRALRLERCKYNLQFQLRENAVGKFNCPHRDCTAEKIVMVYYVNDCDGGTYIFPDENLEKASFIRSKKGRAVFFSGGTLHAGQHPIESPARCVINMNFGL